MSKEQLLYHIDVGSRSEAYGALRSANEACGGKPDCRLVCDAMNRIHRLNNMTSIRNGDTVKEFFTEPADTCPNAGSSYCQDDVAVIPQPALESYVDIDML